LPKSRGFQAGSYATTGRMEPTGQINGREMQINADGTFEIVVSSTPKPGKNWLPMTKDSHSIVVRQTFGDRKKETPAIMKIRCLNGEGDNTLEPIPFVTQLQNTVKFVKNTANLFVDWMEIYREHLNKLPSNNQERCQFHNKSSLREVEWTREDAVEQIRRIDRGVLEERGGLRSADEVAEAARC